VELEWLTRDESFVCPGDDGTVACAADGDIHTWTLQVGQGNRRFRVKATDSAGNVTQSEELSITLMPGADGPVDDGNTLPGSAVPVACGEEIALDGNDADWVEVDAPEGHSVSVTVDGAGAEVVATKGGSEVVADGDGAVEFESDGKTQVAVLPDASGGGGYTVKVECTGDAEGASARKAKARQAEGAELFGCAQGSSPSTWAALGGVLVGIRVRRRRNHR
jgi:hypothetical protein